MSIDTNIRNWSPRKKFAAVLLGLFAIIGLIITIYLGERQQELRGRAEKATNLTLAPPNQSVNINEKTNLDIVINPGVNQVDFVKFAIKFDPTRFDSKSTVFSLNTSSDLEIIQEPLISEGQIVVAIGIGNDSTKVIQSSQSLGTLTLTAGVQNDTQEPELIAGPTKVYFDETQTQVRSIGAKDTFSENVLASTTPATVTIIAVCRPNVATCTWGASDGATSYHYIVTDVSDNKIVEEGDVDSSVTGIEFPSEPGKTYRCEVTAVNECAEAEPSEDEVTCPVPSATPTPGPTGTPTPKPSASPTPKKTGTPTPTPKTTGTPTPSPKTTGTPTPTPRPSSTPTPTTPVSTATPTPTTPVGATSTLAPTTPQGGVETPTPTKTQIAVSTPIPTLPPTGSPVVITGIIGGILFILGGLVLLFL